MVVDVLRRYEGGGESDDKLIEKVLKSNAKMIKLVKIRVWRGRKLRKKGVWGCLEGSWRVLGRLGGLWRDFGRFFWGDIGAKKGATWAKLAASCGQDGPC